MTTRPSIEVAHHVASISMISDDGRQLLDRGAYVALAAALRTTAQVDEVHVVVLRGLDGCFCLGGDISEFLDPSCHPRLIEAVTDLFRCLATFPKPLIAYVDGDAVGVGCTILFHCDMVLATERSTFRVPFVDFGLVPDAATSILAPRRMGYAAAFRFFCLGETLTAGQAAAAGLVGECCPPESAADRVQLVARRLAKKPPRALCETRGLLRGDGRDLCDRVDTEIDLFRAALADETTLRRLKRIAAAA